MNSYKKINLLYSYLIFLVMTLTSFSQVNEAQIFHKISNCEYCYIFAKDRNGQLLKHKFGNNLYFNNCELDAVKIFNNQQLQGALNSKPRIILVVGGNEQLIKRSWYVDSMHPILKDPVLMLEIFINLEKIFNPITPKN